MIDFLRTGLVAKKTEVSIAILKEGGQRKSIGSVVMPSPIWIINILVFWYDPNFQSAYLFSFALVAPRTRIKRKSIAKVKDLDRLISWLVVSDYSLCKLLGTSNTPASLSVMTLHFESVTQRLIQGHCRWYSSISSDSEVPGNCRHS